MYYNSLLAVLAFFLFFHTAVGQNAVNGVVVNGETGEPIPYVNIAVKGKSIGTVSNQNGEFNLSLEGTEKTDSLGFHYIGFENLFLGFEDLYENMTIEIWKTILRIGEISVHAKTYKGRELLELALAHKESNYLQELNASKVFRRQNSATYVDLFDLVLDKSTVPSIDGSFAQSVEDSMIRYSRHFTDHLYEVYYHGGDTLFRYGKSRGIKKVVLDEDIGGEFEQIEKRLEVLFNENDEGVFWKLKTGLVGGKLNDPWETEEEQEAEKQKRLQYIKVRDSIEQYNPYRLSEFRKVNGWNWEFIRKPGRYSYRTTGVVRILDENCYEVSFKGVVASDYTGKLYISAESFAILRIEYHLKSRKEENSLKILGVHYNNPDDSGLVIYEKDDMGYYLKYSMEQYKTAFRIMRPFQLIQKIDKPIFNKRINRIDLHVHMSVRSEECTEFLTVSREAIVIEDYNKIKPYRVQPDSINQYSDKIWEGYSIIEPTKQMKEYRAKTQDPGTSPGQAPDQRRKNNRVTE